MRISIEFWDFFSGEFITGASFWCRKEAWSYSWTTGYELPHSACERYVLNGKRISFSEWTSLPWEPAKA